MRRNQNLLRETISPTSILEINRPSNQNRALKCLVLIVKQPYNQYMNQSAHLYLLQKLDTQLDQIHARVSEIDRLLSEDERVRAARQVTDAAHRDLENARLEARNADHLVSDQQVKIEQSEASLYGGRIHNPKELQDLQKEIESLKRHLATLEDRQLEAMIALEETGQAATVAVSELERTQAEVIQAKAGLAGERDQLLKTRQRLETERSAALSPILEANLQIYNRIREQRKGIAVACIDDETCSTCGAPIRPAEAQAARLQSALHYCSSCGRVLFAG